MHREISVLRFVNQSNAFRRVELAVVDTFIGLAAAAAAVASAIALNIYIHVCVLDRGDDCELWLVASSELDNDLAVVHGATLASFHCL